MNRGRSTLRRLSRPILTAASFRISGVPTSECPVGLLPCQRELADKTGEPKKAMPDDASEWKPDLRALDVEGIVVLLLGTTAAVTIAAAPSMVIGGVIFPEFRYAVLALAVCSLGLSLLRPVWALVGVSLGWPVLDVVSIALDIAQDPTARNLWPIEIVIFSVLSVAVAVVGAMGGWLLRRFVKQRIPAAMILVAAGLVTALRPVVLTGRQISSREAHALSRLTAIVEAQRLYRSQDPADVFACNFDDLNQTFERRESNPPLADDGWANGYHFRLSCTDGTRGMFHVAADPEITNRGGRSPTGLTVYCTDATGQVLSLPAVPTRNCWEEGEPLSSR